MTNIFDQRNQNCTDFDESDFAEIIAKSQKASSMQGNPIKMKDDELATSLRKAI